MIAALRRLGELAQHAGLQLEICIYGGALMMLAYDSRMMTKDVDAVIRPSREGLSLAARVGHELGLPENWLNDDVKMFVAPAGQTRTLPLDFPGIMLTAPTANYLLAMKASNPVLTPPARCRYISTMKAPLQIGSSGRVPAPPAKRFLIS